MSAKNTLPDNCLDDRLGIVGTSGAGKTFAAKGFVERLLKKGARICIPDALGIWWGLRSSANGKKPGYPVTVFGGKHADVDINEHHGAALARLIATTSISTVLDISEFPSMAARRRFMTAFAETIYERNREPLHLVFDEADLWAPQKPQPEAITLLNRMDEIVRRGRVRGFIPWLITQRPAVVNKDVLSQVDILVAMKLTSSQDRDALAGWIEGQADKGEWKEIRTALPTMPRGDGYIWAPSHEILKRVTFPMIETFDSSRTPKRGEKIKGPSKLASIDLSSIKDQLAAIKTEIDSDDPVALRKEIAKLKKDLAAKAPKTPAAAAINVDRESKARAAGYEQSEKDAKVYVNRLRKDFEKILAKLKDDVDKIQHTRLIQINDTIDGILKEWPQPPVIPMTPKPGDMIHGRDSLVHPHKSDPKGDTVEIKGRPHMTYKGARDMAATGRGPEYKVLDIMVARHPERFTKKEWAVIACMKSAGGTWGTYLSRLRTAGMIEDYEDGKIGPTAAGAAAAIDVKAKTTSEILEAWCAEFGGGAAKILRELFDYYPEAMDRANLADKTGMGAGGGTFGTYLSRLKTAGLVVDVGKRKFKATPVFGAGKSATGEE